MVGVAGSSPMAPTKQNPLSWAVWKGSPKGGPFFVAMCEAFATYLLKMTIRRPSLACRFIPLCFFRACFGIFFSRLRSASLNATTE